MELSKGTKGSLAELRVAAHLTSLGFQVYKNLGPNGVCDLVALRGRQNIRVQVKSSLSINSFVNLRQNNNQLLAVLVDGEIHYKAINRAVQRLVPGSILARRPKRHTTSQGKATAKATRKS
jgi:hypothetical protein